MFNIDFFKPYYEELLDLNSFNTIAMRGFQVSFAMKQSKENLESDRFLEEETISGYPYLNKLNITRLWSILEYLVDDLVVELLEHEDIRRLENIRKLKGSLIDFISLGVNEQSEYILDLLKLETKSSLKVGIGRFESLLNSVELGGGIHEYIRRIFLELSQIRNVLVHKNGIVDQRLIDNCPWLRYQLGDVILPTHFDYKRFMRAIEWYILELNRRIIIKFVEESEKISEEFNWIERELNTIIDEIKSIEESKRASDFR